MKVRYTIEDVPEHDIALDGCEAEVEPQGDGNYTVKAVCEDD